MPHTPEISPAEPEASPEHWYSSGPENQTTPVVSPQHSSLEEKSEIEGESASEKFDGSSEGSTYSPPKKKKKKMLQNKFNTLRYQNLMNQNSLQLKQKKQGNQKFKAEFYSRWHLVW